MKAIKEADSMQHATPFKRVLVQKDLQQGRQENQQESRRDPSGAQPATGFRSLLAANAAPFPNTESGQRSGWFQATRQPVAFGKVPEPSPAALPPQLGPTRAPAGSRPWPYWLLFGIVLLVCAYLLLRPTPVPQWFAESDKLGHAGFFFTLALLGYGATARVGTSFVVLVIGLFGLAIGSEWLQQTSLLPLRHANASDLAADIIGLALGLALAVTLEQRRRWSLRTDRSV